MLHYTRLLIEMPLDATFPEFIEFINDKNVLVWQQVRYKWKPVQCFYCQMLGHDEIICKKKGRLRQEWREKQTVIPTESNMEKQATQPTQLGEMKMDRFIPVHRRDAAWVVTQPHISTSPARNSY